MKQRQKNTQKGITLIALIITIIVMLILVAVTITIAVNGGLFEQAGRATKETHNAINAEQQLANGGITIGDTHYNSIDDYLYGPKLKYEIINKNQIGICLENSIFDCFYFRGITDLNEVDKILENNVFGMTAEEFAQLSYEEQEKLTTVDVVTPDGEIIKLSYIDSDNVTILYTCPQEGNYTFKATNSKGRSSEITVAIEGDIPTGPVVTINGSQVTLTKDNVHEYLGKIVTNYTGQSSVSIDNIEYKVSPTYRLYYVDFDNKYKDGAGTIYLKAECTSNNYALPTTDTSSDTAKNIKIRTLNPALYANGVTAPTSDNMKAVTWLTNITNWSTLADTTMSSNINYIVGSPSLEMMMDSYNTCYQLTGDTPDTGTLTEGERTKLFYKYESGDSGYRVGPSRSGYAQKGYWYQTSANSVSTDNLRDSMYYPGADQKYWLASPSADNFYYPEAVCSIDGSWGGVVEQDIRYYLALCPVVSLKPSTQLELE